jgi:hypothetical protein
VPELTHKQVLVHLASDRSRTRIDPTPRTILLESWILTFTRSQSPRSQDVDRPDVAPSTIYKHGIPLFRSVFTLLRILPSWKLYKRLRRRTGGTNRNGNLSIQLRVAPSERSADILDFGEPTFLTTMHRSNDKSYTPQIHHQLQTLYRYQMTHTSFLPSPTRWVPSQSKQDTSPPLTSNSKNWSLCSPPVSSRSTKAQSSHLPSPRITSATPSLVQDPRRAFPYAYRCRGRPQSGVSHP